MLTKAIQMTKDCELNNDRIVHAFGVVEAGADENASEVHNP